MKDDLLTTEEKQQLLDRVEESRKTTFYLVTMMGGKQYSVDQEELQLVQGGMDSGSFVQLKQAIVNPSMITSLETDRERIAEWNKRLDKYAERVDNARESTYGQALGAYPNTPELVDIFDRLDARIKINLPKK